MELEQKAKMEVWRKMYPTLMQAIEKGSATDPIHQARMQLQTWIKQLDLREKACELQQATRPATIAGQAFTSYECQCCHETHLWMNTATPYFCLSCAEQWSRQLSLWQEEVEEQ